MTQINKEYTTDILPDVTTINFTMQEQSKLKAFFVEEIGNLHLFSYMKVVYSYIKINFNNPQHFIIIPFVDEKNRPHINIQKIV